MDNSLVYVLVEKENLNNRIAYTIKTIFSFLGYDYKIIINEESNRPDALAKNNLCIYFGSKVDKFSWCDLVIPLKDYNQWLTAQVEVTYLEGMPILYVQNKPSFIIRGNILGFDLLNLVFYLLSRQEEQLIAQKDQWGRFPSGQSYLCKYGIIDRPIIDYYIKYLRHFLEEVSKNKDLHLKSKGLWKNNKKFAVSLSHDVDFLNLYNLRYGLSLIKNYLVNRLGGLWGGMRHALFGLGRNLTGIRDPLWTIEQLMFLEDSLGFRSTFFFSIPVKEPDLNDPFYRLDDKISFRNKKCSIAEVMKYMEQEGWEIGLHGSIGSLYEDNLFIKEKDFLAKTLNRNKLGNRQHFLRFDTASCWPAFEKAGLAYDASLGYIDRLGYRAGTGYPFAPFDLKSDRPLNMLEIPLIFIEGVLEREGNITEEVAFEICMRYISETEATGGMLSILWHTHNLYRKQCKIDWALVYRMVLSELRKKDAWVAALGEIAEWWRDKKQKEN